MLGSFPSYHAASVPHFFATQNDCYVHWEHVMQQFSCQIELGGVPLQCRLGFQESQRFFERHALLTQREPVGVIAASDEDWSYMERSGFARDALSETTMIVALASDLLLQQNRCMIHAVAIRHKDDAWLITAPSGVGKSTQVRTLQELYPGEFSVICGDRPVLELLDGGGAFVHPSPWNGKEGWHGAEGAALAGIICLERGNEDLVLPLSKRDSVVPVFHALIQSGKTPSGIRSAAAFEEELLNRTSLWRMVNRDIPGSTKLLYHTLFE